MRVRVMMPAWLALLLPLGGCAWKAERVAERAAPTGVEATLEMLAEKENQLLLAEVLDTVLSEQSVRTIVRGAVSGAADGLADPENRALFSTYWEELIDAFMRWVGHGIERDIEPRVAAVVRTVQEAFRSDLEYALSSPAREQLQEFASETSRAISREVVLGLRDGMQDLDEEERASLPMVAEIDGWFERGINLAAIAAVVLGLVAGVLALVVAIVLSRLRRARLASERRLVTTLLLFETARGWKSPHIAPEDVDRLFDQLDGNPDEVVRAIKDRLAAPEPAAAAPAR